MITYTHVVGSNFPLRTLVARRLQTNTHILTYSIIHTLILYSLEAEYHAINLTESLYIIHCYNVIVMVVKQGGWRMLWDSAFQRKDDDHNCLIGKSLCIIL